MPIEFIGALSSRQGSESVEAQGPIIDKSWLSAIARAHEYAGFDRALVAYSSSSPDAYQIAAFAAHQTESLKLLLAHRPGFQVPTLAARSLASLDHFSEGRLAVHIISGGSDTEQQKDGDYLAHDERYERTDEYLDVVKKTWLSDKPFDHEGKHYRVKDNFAGIKPLQQPHLPVYFGGSSEAAIRVAGKHADVFALWGEPLDQVRDTIAGVRASAALHGRENHIRFSLSLRPILAPTEAQAWAKAERTLERARDLVARSPRHLQRQADGGPRNVGSKRLLEAASRGKVVDARLWTEIAALTGAAGNSTSLVGTPDQVTESLLAYHDLGVTTFLIRGFDPLQDALQYGRELIPLVRAEVARRDAGQPAAAQALAA